jgi:hypothetical protein
MQPNGVDISTRSDALQNVVWSVAVQHGSGTPLIHRAIATLQSQQDKTCDSDADLIEAIYAERTRLGPDGSLAYFSKNSQGVQNGVKNRFQQERSDALAWLQQDAETA